jgi:hypothetical protein
MNQRVAKRAYTAKEVLRMHIPSYEFEGKWYAAIGNPGRGGTWIIWGASGNGKSSFVMQLAKYLSGFERVIYDSLEEGTSLSFQKSLRRHGLEQVSGLTILDREPIAELEKRLAKKKSPGVVIIDSYQYSGLTYQSYCRLKERFAKKLLIFISHADGKRPEGRSAKRVEYDADVKIYVSCFRAVCKSRFLDHPGEPIIIWEEGAAKALADAKAEERDRASPEEEPETAPEEEDSNVVRGPF